MSGLALVLLLFAAGCGVRPPTSPLARFTPTPMLAPTPTTAPTPTPTPIPIPTPTSIPTPTPVPTPPTLPEVCIPGPSVTPVSTSVIYSGAGSKRQVSLTFDSDGGSAGNAYAYLDILSAHGIHATWFLTGDFAQANPDIVRRIRDDGHNIGNHTVDHPELIAPPRSDSFICSQLVGADHMIANITDRTTRPFFRPPYGDFNTQIRTLAAGLGYRTIYWSIDPRDWDPNTTTQNILNRVLNSSSLKPGAIILMHVNSPNERYALNGVIDGLLQRDYAIVPLSQLFA
jgi:peptidoglycan/xylan/chitin deacetylase (PgdA/CDA1 family)